MRTIILIVLVLLSFSTRNGKAGSIEVTNHAFIESMTKLADLMNLTNFTKADAARLEVVSRKLAELREKNGLPELNKDAHGEASVYSMPKENQKVWVEEHWMTERMVADIADCKYAYLCAAHVKSNTFFYFLCLNPQGQQDELKLVSAYRYQKTNWVRLPIDEKSSKEPKQ
jgi:hypothetical protein